MTPEERELMERLVKAAEASKPLSAARGVYLILWGVVIVSAIFWFVARLGHE